MDTIKDLVDRLNVIDECSGIEAKRGSGIDRSILETVCELGLGGRYIIPDQSGILI